MVEQNEMTPAASWGAVAKEAVKHPYQSGLTDIGAGVAWLGLGLTHHQPLLTAGGMIMEGLGVDEFRSFAMKKRYPSLDA